MLRKRRSSCVSSPRPLSGPFLGASSSDAGLGRTASGQGRGRREDLCQTVVVPATLQGHGGCHLCPRLASVASPGQGQGRSGSLVSCSGSGCCPEGGSDFPKATQRSGLASGRAGLARPPPCPHQPLGPVLSRSLGVQHDGIGNDCDSVGKQHFIMSPQLLYDSAPLIWSPCSQQYITRFFE